MRVKLKIKQATHRTEYASDLLAGTWFLDEDNDVSLIVNNRGKKNILCFEVDAPFIRGGTLLNEIEVRRVLEPAELEFCE